MLKRDYVTRHFKNWMRKWQSPFTEGKTRRGWFTCITTLFGDSRSKVTSTSSTVVSPTVLTMSQTLFYHYFFLIGHFCKPKHFFYLNQKELFNAKVSFTKKHLPHIFSILSRSIPSRTSLPNIFLQMKSNLTQTLWIFTVLL